jgi:uncharacterized protein (DUF302 family)
MRLALLALMAVLAAPALASPPAVYKKTVAMDIDTAQARVYEALEDQRFYVVFEADMGARMARFAQRWGEDYNRQGLSGVRSLVFCHIWWTNQIASADPDMLALCPLHLSLYEKDGKTSLVMPRPSVMARGSGAEAQAAELEEELTAIIEGALE